MFQRYTESARRTIFFARYEASQYGSPYIETEHLVLGLLRERRSLVKWFPGQTNVEPQIRAEIEKRISPRERISTTVEMPLSAECKLVLNLAVDTCDRLGHNHVEPEHLLIGILRVETSLAAQVLSARGLKPEPIQAQLAKAPSPKYQAKATIGPSLVLDSFLEGLKWLKSAELVPFFAANAESMSLEVDGITMKFARTLKSFSLLTQRETRITPSNQRWPRLANCLLLLFFGRMPFSPANSASGCTA